MKNILIYIIISFIPVFGRSQNSLKLKQQKTSFIYLKSNFIFGCIELDDGFKWLPITKNPLNQVSLVFHKKNQRLLQRGYVKSIALSDFRVKASLTYFNSLINDKYEAGIGLNLNDMWVNFKTKNYRTSLRVGYTTLPYGHNPKVDPDYSFIPNIGGVDMNLNRDLGFFYKTALSKKMDLEFSFTSGGFIKNHLLRYRFNNETPWNNRKLVYDNTWLTIIRLGLASFNKNEIGLFASLGNIKLNTHENLTDVKRVGAEWIFKHNDDLHMTHQLLYGVDDHFGGGTDKKVIFQSVFECFWHNKWIVAMSQSTQLIMLRQENNLNKGQYTASLGYAFTPHVRLKLNGFYALKDFNQKGQLGAYIQLVAGIGQRP